MLVELLNTLQRELDLVSPQEVEEKIYSIEIAPDLIITATDLEPGVSLFGKLGLLQKEKREELFSYLMRANLLHQGTGDCFIGLDTDEKFLTLSSIFPYEIDYKEFKEVLEDFVNYLIYWRKEIAKKYQETVDNRF